MKILYQRLKEILAENEASPEIKEISNQIITRMNKSSTEK